MNGQIVEYKEITPKEFEVLAGFINLVAAEGGFYFDRQAIQLAATGMTPVVISKGEQLFMRDDYRPVLMFGAIQSVLSGEKSEPEKQIVAPEQKPDTATVKAHLQALFAAVMETYAADFVASNPSPVAKRGFTQYEQDVQQDLKNILDQF